jgi:hypothetical protein
LRIVEHPAPAVPAAVTAALADVRATNARPDGEILLDALSSSRCARELACGFYYRWEFPRGESVRLIDEWLATRKAWRKELRAKLAAREPHLDSPLLCTRAAARAWGDEAIPVVDDEGNDTADPSFAVTSPREVPLWRAKEWPAWRDIRNEVQPVSVAVRLDPFLAEHAARWALENRGIVWYDKREFGAWVAELSGLPMHGGGADAEQRIAQERGERSIVVSIPSHGTGRDGLQRLYADQLIANPSASATTWEQLLGRLYRVGQDAPVVWARFYRHTEEIRDIVDRAMSRAVYVQSTIGARQKIVAAFGA